MAGAVSGRHNGATCDRLTYRRIPIKLSPSFQISELLGSFGDNELSPECLDGAQRFLKHDGINIPVSYTALIAPVQTSRLWQVGPVQTLLLFSFEVLCLALFSHAQLCFAWLQDIKNFEKADAWETAYVCAVNCSLPRLLLRPSVTTTVDTPAAMSSR